MSITRTLLVIFWIWNKIISFAFTTSLINIQQSFWCPPKQTTSLMKLKTARLKNVDRSPDKCATIYEKQRTNDYLNTALGRVGPREDTSQWINCRGSRERGKNVAKKIAPYEPGTEMAFKNVRTHNVCDCLVFAHRLVKNPFVSRLKNGILKPRDGLYSLGTFCGFFGIRGGFIQLEHHWPQQITYWTKAFLSVFGQWIY